MTKEYIENTGTVCNRHMARLLCDLEDGNCPQIYIDAVKTELAWLRKDLDELTKKKDGDE